MKEASHTCEGDEWSYIHEAKPPVEGSKSHTGMEKKKKNRYSDQSQTMRVAIENATWVAVNGKRDSQALWNSQYNTMCLRCQP